MTKWIITKTACGRYFEHAVCITRSYPLDDVAAWVTILHAILLDLPYSDVRNQVFDMLSDHMKHCEKCDQNVSKSKRDITNDLNALDNLINAYNLGQQNQ